VAAPDAKFMEAPWALHPYPYVDQNPISYWDPDGRDPSPAASAYTVHVLRYVSEDRFVGGFHGDGATRGPTADPRASHRTGLNVQFDAVSMNVRQVTGSTTGSELDEWSASSAFVANFETAWWHKEELSAFCEVRTEAFQFGRFIHGSSAGSDPLIVPAPNIDTFIDFTASRTSDKLHIVGLVSGDKFTSTDALLTDAAGHTILLGTAKSRGTPFSLLGVGDHELIRINAEIPVNPDGTFKSGSP
jgi:hypothetical protein